LLRRAEEDALVVKNERLEDRVRGEFLEMPGLILTARQASRLWGIDRLTSEWILDRLVSVGFLTRTRRGAYMLANNEA
jgi:predicted transcriptional regulator of viral defense system